MNVIRMIKERKKKMIAVQPRREFGFVASVRGSFKKAEKEAVVKKNRETLEKEYGENIKGKKKKKVIKLAKYLDRRGKIQKTESPFAPTTSDKTRQILGMK